MAVNAIAYFGSRGRDFTQPLTRQNVRRIAPKMFNNQLCPLYLLKLVCKTPLSFQDDPRQAVSSCRQIKAHFHSGHICLHNFAYY